MNDCTDDVCAGGVCTHPSSMMGAACGDGEETACDNPDTCDGNGNCQPNYEPMTTECRASAGVCDVAEFCDGAGNCPADAFQPNGTPCDDSLFCNGTDTCTGGICIVDSGDPCPGESCNETTDECYLYGDLNDDGVVDIDDIFCVLDDFSNRNACSGDGDIFPCGGGNGLIDLDDILAILDTISGSPPC